MRASPRVVPVPVAVVLALVTPLVAACDDNGNRGGGTTPAGPSRQVLQVAGTYTGPVTLVVAGSSTTAGSARMVVAQSGSQLTITGSVTISGQTIQIAAVTGTINATGFFNATGGGSLTDTIQEPTCGTMRATSSTLTFSGSTARFVEDYTTTRCGPVQVSATLRR